MCRAGLIESNGHRVARVYNRIIDMFMSDPRYQLVMNNIEIVREFNAEII